MATTENSGNSPRGGTVSFWYEFGTNLTTTNDNAQNDRNNETLSPRFYFFLNIVHFVILLSLAGFFIWFLTDLHAHKPSPELDIIDWMIILWILRSAWSVLNWFIASDYHRRGLPLTKGLNISITCSNAAFMLWIISTFLLIYFNMKASSKSYSCHTCIVLFWISCIIFVLPKTFYLLLLGFVYLLLFIVFRLRARDSAYPTSKTPKEIIDKLKPKKFKDVKDDILESGTASNKLNEIQLDYSTPTCPICIVELIANDSVIIMPCDQRHYFHKNCLLSWLNRSQECPICRTNIVEYYKMEEV